VKLKCGIKTLNSTKYRARMHDDVVSASLRLNPIYAGLAR
jgi:hypothetical protein